MLYILRFFDKPDQSAIRQEFFPAHVQWLDANRAKVLVPGALRQAADDKAVGGLWLVEAESVAEIEKLFQTDPFWANGLRERYEIFRWVKAFPDRQVSI